MRLGLGQSRFSFGTFCSGKTKTQAGYGSPKGSRFPLLSVCCSGSQNFMQKYFSFLAAQMPTSKTSIFKISIPLSPVQSLLVSHSFPTGPVHGSVAKPKSRAPDWRIVWNSLQFSSQRSSLRRWLKAQAYTARKTKQEFGWGRTNGNTQGRMHPNLRLYVLGWIEKIVHPNGLILTWTCFNSISGPCKTHHVCLCDFAKCCKENPICQNST